MVAVEVLIGNDDTFLFIMQALLAVIAKIIFGVPDKMSGKPSALCRTF